MNYHRVRRTPGGIYDARDEVNDQGVISGQRLDDGDERERPLLVDGPLDLPFCW